MATEEPFIPAPGISSELRAMTGDSGPGHRALVAMANDAKISPPLERRGRFWGCRESRLPELAELLGLPRNPYRLTGRRRLVLGDSIDDVLEIEN